MANWCSVYFRWTLGDESSAEALERFLSQQIERANGVRSAMYMGSWKRWIFEPEVDINGNEVTMYCEVKWAINQDEIKDMLAYIAWFSNPDKLLSMTCEYEETGCCIYGEFQYTKAAGSSSELGKAGPAFTDHYLPAEHWPKSDDDKPGAYVDDVYYDSYEEALREALNKHGAFEALETPI